MMNLSHIMPYETRSVCPENITGEKGKGGMTPLEQGTAYNAARDLGTGWKVNPYFHVEAGETLAQTALREVREETGVRAMLHTFQPVMVDEYPIAGGDLKRVSWFVARYDNQTPVADRTQVLGVLVLPVETAIKTLTYGSTKEILRRVDEQLG